MYVIRKVKKGECWGIFERIIQLIHYIGGAFRAVCQRIAR